MKALIEQIQSKNFKPSNFTIYSIMEEDGFIFELERIFGEKYVVDDLEYIVLDLTIKEKNGIKYYMSYMTNRINDLKKILEKDIQDDPEKSKVRIYVDREKLFILVVKLKDFDLLERLENINIGGETDVPTN